MCVCNGEKRQLGTRNVLLESLVFLVGHLALWFAISKALADLCWLHSHHAVDMGAMVVKQATAEDDCCCYCSASEAVEGFVVHEYAWEGKAA